MRAYFEHAGETLELPLGETFIGRDATSAVRIEDGSFSRRHARFVLRSDALFIEDMDSANGTRLNGTRVRVGDGRRLRDGDAIAISTFDATIRIPASEANQPPAFRSIVDALQGRTPTTWTPGTVPSPVVDPRCPRCGAQLTPAAHGCAACPYRWDEPPPPNGWSLAPVPSNPLRWFTRAQFAIRVDYASATYNEEAQTRDVSASGMLLATQLSEPVGTRCRLALHTYGGRLELNGVVRRLAGSGLAIAFDGVGDAERERLNSLVTRRG